MGGIRKEEKRLKISHSSVGLLQDNSNCKKSGLSPCRASCGGFAHRTKAQELPKPREF